MKILLTGYTGNLGGEIARQLAPHRVLALTRNPVEATEGVELIHGSLEELPTHRTPEIEVIVHGAASTAFRAPAEELRHINVDGTARLLEFARQCPRLQRFIHLSTACVCGNQSGLIPECPLPRPRAFVNPYEESKWEAEQVVLKSDLPVEIARLSIVAGSELDGSVRRIGALHHTLFWLFKGLIPMLPGRETSQVDLISTEFAAKGISALVAANPQPGRIVHIASGRQAPQLRELLDFLAELFVRHHHGWSSRAIAIPDIVDAETFAMFQESARRSGDLIFQRVCDDAEAFLPGLLHPRLVATSFAHQLALPDWRVLTQRVFTWLQANHWGRATKPLSYARA